MNEKNLVIVVGIISLFLLIGLAVYTTWNHFQLIEVLNDTNTLKNNDIGFVNYIQSNATTLQYINENCKVTNDTNEITVLTCIKPKGN